MKALTVLNGAADKEIARSIEKSARVSGFLTYKPDEELWKEYMPECDLLFVDRKGAEIYQRLAGELFKNGCPVIMIHAAENETHMSRPYKKHITARVSYPFMLREFRMLAENYISPDMIKNRDLYYGALYIDKGIRKILYKNKEVYLGMSAYKILIYLLEHIGTAVGREELNGILPDRKRENMRNVDTHIKNIRHILGMNEVIRSVRSVGYRIDEEKFYEWIPL